MMKFKKGTKRFMLIKVDLEKAYDRLDWNFLENTLEDLGFRSHFVELIMSCVSTTMKVI